MEPADSPGVAVPGLRVGARVLADLAHEEDDFFCRDPRPQLLDRDAGGRRLKLHARGLVNVAGAVCEFPEHVSSLPAQRCPRPGREVGRGERSAGGVLRSGLGLLVVARVAGDRGGGAGEVGADAVSVDDAAVLLVALVAPAGGVLASDDDDGIPSVE